MSPLPIARHLPPLSPGRFIRTARVGLSICLVSVACTAAAGVVAFQRSEAATGWVAHTYDVIMALQRVRGSVARANASQHAFLLTGEQTHETEFLAAMQVADSALTASRQLTADNAVQQHRILALEPQVVAYFARLAGDVSWTGPEQGTRSLASIRTAVGEADRQSRAIDQAIDVLRREELRLLALRRDDDAQSHRVLHWTFALGILSMLLGCMVAYGRIREELEARRRADQARDTAIDALSDAAADANALQVVQTALLRDRTHALRAQTVELREAKAAARAADVAKATFLEQMSHELRTPLTAVLGFTQVLKLKTADRLTAAELDYLDRIHAAGTRLLTLVSHALDLAAATEGHLPIAVEPCNLATLIEDVVRPFAAQAAAKGLTCTVAQTVHGVASVTTDARHLKTMLASLLDNAVKFTATGGITVTLGRGEGTEHPYRIEVADTGVGIAPDRLPVIFEAFAQASTGRTRSHDGAGLGLSASRAIADRLGHRLSVESTPGVGTRVAIAIGDTPG